MSGITVPYGLVLDLPTALDVADTYIQQHLLVCKGDGSCPPMPPIVRAAINVTQLAGQVDAFPHNVGIG